jgi:hypothetical protein
VPEDSVRAPLTKAELKKVGLRGLENDEGEKRIRLKRGKQFGRNLRGRDRKKHLETPPPVT